MEERGAEPAARGTGNGMAFLQVESVARASAVTHARCHTPVKLLVPRPRGPSVWGYLSSFGGGMVAGDQSDVRIRIGAGARALLSTQASTKIYRNAGLGPCIQTLRAEVESGGLLVYAPDPIQCFAGAEYRQIQTFDLKPGAALVVVDWLSAGRTARGERWRFRRFESRTDVFIGGEKLFRDALLLDPADGALDGPRRMGRFNCIGWAAVIGESLSVFARQILDEVASEPVVRRGSLITSASPISNGAILRLAGCSVEQVGARLVQHLGFVSDLLADDPWARKW